jgi:quercetin dioxygenase-like cupin family protein
VRVVDAGPMRPRPERPRVQGRAPVATDELVLGEWSLTAAAWTDRHQHEETNWVLEGELHVTCDGHTEVVGPGRMVIVPAGTLARYAAPVHARMIYVYGPSTDGHAMSDGRYEELGASSDSPEGIAAIRHSAHDRRMEHDPSTAAVIDQFNRAFVEHRPELLDGIIDVACVMESVDPAPDGQRYEGAASCTAFWKALAEDTASSFAPEAIDILGDRAIIRWRYRFPDGSVRGVNLMRVTDGRIVEALGYTKSGDAAVTGALENARS